MIRPVNSSKIAAPFSNYSHGMLIEPGAQVLYVSGQLGIDSDGRLLDGFPAQMKQAMKNLFAVLEEAVMAPSDIVKLTVLSSVHDEASVSAYRDIRDRMLGDHTPAALFVAVSGFTHPGFLVEIEAVAAAIPKARQ